MGVGGRSGNHARPLLALVGVLACLVAASCGSTRIVRGPTMHQSTARISTPRYGATATVHPGDTLYRIAVGNGISPLDLAMWNAVPPPYTIHPGQRLRLYPSDRAAARSVASAPRPRAPAVQPPSGSVRAPTVDSTPAAPILVPGASPFTWTWPADGSITGRYVAGEPTQQGIDIAGQEGQPVRAAADGVVVYSGSGLVGYGELVIVKHNDAWLSAYGHNRSRLVNEGQRVTAGQQIAQMGHTGAARDVLHFEIRYNGKPVDPLAYLPKK
ncbi:peptidoglycan DD-metalloendopeptidase family protein [Cognatiluteimonas profundi]|uniref:peptidoglycan DD-metalloendopeptidase family protein n=1 Tax=Cognatiluteimonas profundi TaxID=2594501 RepID=UPI00131BD02A